MGFEGEPLMSQKQEQPQVLRLHLAQKRAKFRSG
jgi:hypothetical protein